MTIITRLVPVVVAVLVAAMEELVHMLVLITLNQIRPEIKEATKATTPMTLSIVDGSQFQQAKANSLHPIHLPKEVFPKDKAQIVISGRISQLKTSRQASGISLSKQVMAKNLRITNN